LKFVVDRNPILYDCKVGAVFSIPFGCVSKLLILYNGLQTLHRKLEIEHIMLSIRYKTKLLIIKYQIIESSGRNHLEFPINWRTHQLYSHIK
jgi:hypothetical protein